MNCIGQPHISGDIFNDYKNILKTDFKIKKCDNISSSNYYNLIAIKNKNPLYENISSTPEEHSMFIPNKPSLVAPNNSEYVLSINNNYIGYDKNNMKLYESITDEKVKFVLEWNNNNTTSVFKENSESTSKRVEIRDKRNRIILREVDINTDRPKIFTEELKIFNQRDKIKQIEDIYTLDLNAKNNNLQSIRTTSKNNELFKILNGNFMLKLKGNLSNTDWDIGFYDGNKGADDTPGSKEIRLMRTSANDIRFKIVDHYGNYAYKVFPLTRNIKINDLEFSCKKNSVFKNVSPLKNGKFLMKMI